MQDHEGRERCNPDPDCPWCMGAGTVDSGGFTPWDAPIGVACSCTYVDTSSFIGGKLDKREM